MAIFQLIRSTILPTIGFFLLTLVLSVSLLYVVGLIPSSAMQRSLEHSLPILISEGQYPSVGPLGRQIVLDNFTDSLILNTSYVSDTSRPLRSVLLNNRGVAEPNEIDQIVNLEAYVRGQSDQVVQYERYWHGYLVTLRPLLMIFSLSTIRIVLTIAHFALASVLLFLTWKHIDWKIALSLFVGLLWVDFWLIGGSVQFSSVFILGLIASIYYVRNKLSLQGTMQLFFVLGCVVAFFDLLTAPMVSLGLLVSVVLARTNSNLSLLGILYWFAGYGLFWMSKWILVEAIVQPGAIATALDQVVNRTVVQADSNFSHAAAILLNLKQLAGYSFASQLILGLLVGLSSLALIRYGYFSKVVIRKILPWLVLAIIPYFWYVIAANHSYLHVWYTYRAQLLTVIAMSMIVLTVIREKVVKQDILRVRGWVRSQST